MVLCAHPHSSLEVREDEYLAWESSKMQIFSRERYMSPVHSGLTHIIHSELSLRLLWVKPIHLVQITFRQFYQEKDQRSGTEKCILKQ